MPGQSEPGSIREIRNNYIAGLTPLYERRECERIVEMVFQSLAGISRIDFALDPGRVIPETSLAELTRALEELKTGRPVQYVLGFADFFGLRIEVNESVLIPRQETEELVKWAIDDHRGRKKLKILDIGTGSGCLALTLQRFLPGSQVFAGDISSGAILLAEKNARSLSLPVTFFKLDILDHDNPPRRMTYDLIISNPPYVTMREQKFMKQNVLGFEPHEALFVPNDDPLMFYRAIIGFSSHHLDEAGAVYVEINEQLADDTARLFEKGGFSLVTVRKDLNGKARMIRAVR